MIADSLRNYRRYVELHPRFATAFSHLLEVDFARMPQGRNEIDGDEIYMIMTRGELKKPENTALEVHNRYIDIQLVIEGCETFGWRERSELVLPCADFNREKDIQFFNDAPTTLYHLHAGQMSIYFPQDAHAPMLGEGAIVKCVVKVLL